MDAKPSPPAETAALIVAAGRGLRAGGGVPKQFRALAGEAVLSRTIRAFDSHPSIDALCLVLNPDDAEHFAEIAPDVSKPMTVVDGGNSRAESVLKGLRAIRDETVLVHDGARPLIDAATIASVIEGLARADGAVAMIPAVDAMRKVGDDGALGAPVLRDGVRRAQTPQGFRTAALREALERRAAAGTLESCPDEAAAALEAGLRVIAVAGDPLNIKLTTPEDFDMAERLLASAGETRIGQGFDVHAFGPGDSVVLCGVRIPHERGLAGHSDADVGLHALTDALLGAIAAGDIGRHFPPSDPQWKGADSALFLRRAVELVGAAGFAISNVDVTLICERPKIGPHAEAMRARVGELCGIETGRVSVKATTTERLGFCGREEGIAAMASACLQGKRA